MSISSLLERKFSLHLKHFSKHGTLYALGALTLFLTAIGIYSYHYQKKKTESLVNEVKRLQETAGSLSRSLKEKEIKRVSPETPSYLGFTATGGFTELNSEKENLYIPMGSIFKAVLITSIKTSLAESYVMAKTTRTFEMDSKRRIPLGTKLIGSARLNPVLKGVVIRFHHLVTPEGYEYPASILALSSHAFPELEGLFFSDKLETYGSALAFGFLSGFADASKDRETTLLGSEAKPNLHNKVLSGLSSASFQIAEDLLKDVKDSAIEYVVLPAGEEIYVVLENRFTLDSKKGALE